MELADTTAWAWSNRDDLPELRADFDSRLERGEVAVCDMVRFELLYSARNAREYEWSSLRLLAFPECPITEEAWKRALWVYGELAKKGGAHQRSVQHADLLIAATAELAGVPVLHYDEDYDRIAAVTGQPTRWLAPRGSLG